MEYWLEEQADYLGIGYNDCWHELVTSDATCYTLIRAGMELLKILGENSFQKLIADEIAFHSYGEAVKMVCDRIKKLHSTSKNYLA